MRYRGTCIARGWPQSRRMLLEPLEERRMLALGDVFQMLVDYDFGDAPDTGASTGPGNYQTLSTSGGPSHAIERAQAAVADGSIGGIETLTFPAVPDGFTGTTYARFRLSTDALAADPTGPASDGEVEDYAVVITSHSNGTVKAHQKISDTEGNFTGLLDDYDFFGNSAANVGDLDGDGVTDLAVGAYGDKGTFRGAVWILFLNPDGTVKTQQKIDDTEGNFTGPLDDGDLFGSSVANVGDLDGDGVTDLAVGAHADGDGGYGRGAVWILFLGADGTVKSHQKISDTEGGFTGTLGDMDLFGNSVANVGDLDGDGVTDLAVGAYGDGGTFRGAVWMLFLNSDGTVKAHQKISDTEGNFTGLLEDSDFFGSSVANVGDLDGDGVTDLAVGADGDGDGGISRGAVWMLFLNSDGTVKAHQKISDTQGNFSGLLDDSDYFGYSVANVGDLDGNGLTDLAVGAFDDDDGGTDRGAVWMLFLNSDGTVKAHQKISDTQGNFSGLLDDSDYIGYSVANVGDLDGDGLTDLAVGASGDDDGGTDPGAVWMLFLAPEWDYGDAPLPYPTLVANDGARHVGTGPTLGSNRDTEFHGQPTATADGDDTTGWLDDEDGVTVPVLTAWTAADTTARVVIDLENADATANYLDAWIDFNSDGDWDDSGEQVFTSYDLGTTSGTQSLRFTVPQDTGGNVVYGTTYARFRLSTAGGLSATGAADDGEVEDYPVVVTWFGPPEALNTNAGSDSGDDASPQLATDGAGNWVAVWSSGDSLGGSIGGDRDIFVSRSTDAGGAWTVPAALNTNAGSDSGEDWYPQVETDAAGNWVAVWYSDDDLGGTIDTDYDVLVSCSTDNGVTWTAPAALNSNAATDSGGDWAPQVTTDGAGNWVAAWHSDDTLGETIGADTDILVSRSTDAGSTWTAPAPLNTNASSDSGADGAAQVAADALGNWVSVWRSEDDLGGSIGTDGDILVSRSTDAGATWTAPANLNTNAATDSGGDDNPQVSTDGAGNWVAVWDSFENLGGTISADGDILVSRSANVGVTWTAPVPLNANAGSDSGHDYAPQVTTDGAGNWVAVWDSDDDLGGTIGADRDIVVSRSVDAGGTWTAPAPLNTNAASDSGDDLQSQVTTDGAGNWVAVWHSMENLHGTIGADMDILFATFFLWDYADAPSPYPTLLADVGARHVATGPRLGTDRDTEADGQPTATANGDDTTGRPDDEDGVIVPVLTASTLSTTTASATVDLQNADATANYLDAWVDFNSDGDWDDSGEQVCTSYDLGTSGGAQSLTFTVPRDTGGNIVYGTTYARFRLSTTGGLSPTGPAADGEVEDYPVAVTWFGPPEALNTNAGSDSGGDGSLEVTTDGAGNWVAVWNSGDSLGGTIGTDYDILVSRSTDAGGTWTAPAPLNANADSDSGNDYDPDVTTDALGNWVAVWRSNDSLGGTIGTDWDILVSRSSDTGGTWTAPAPLNSYAGSDSGGGDYWAQVTTDGAGNWVAVWVSGNSLDGTIGSDWDILLSRSTDAGRTWTAAAALNTNATTDSGYDNQPQVTTDGTGNWVAVWGSGDSLGGMIGSDYDILVSRSTDGGGTWTAPATLNTNAGSDSGSDQTPQVTTDGAGNWVAVWRSGDTLGGTIGWDYDILVSRSTDAGGTWTAPATLNSYADSDSENDYEPQVTTDGAGNWLAVWQSEDSLGRTIGSDWDILVSRSSDAGGTWTSPAPLNSYAGSDSESDWHARVTTDGAGNWLTTWGTSYDLGGTIGTDSDILFATFSEILWDYGDAPTAAQSGFPTSYPTTLADQGARHAATGPKLGLRRDGNADGAPSPAADGDDSVGQFDDEDGVTVPSLSRGQTVNLSIEVGGAAGYVDAWIDFSADGDWLDAGEKIHSNQLAVGTHQIPVTVPTGATTGTTYARFRISTAGGLAPDGAADDGEVEDYLVVIDEAPTVTSVWVRGSNWDSDFLAHLGTLDVGGTNGYAIPVGSAAQLATLPWGNIDTITIEFSEDVNVAKTDLDLRGVTVAQYGFVAANPEGFSYDSGNHVATWKLNQEIDEPDKLLIDLGGVTDTAGIALDGEWTDSTSGYPSGNGTASGDFQFRFNVLPGDADQSEWVLTADWRLIRSKLGKVPGDAEYSIFCDVDASAWILTADWRDARSRLLDQPPSGDPPAAGDVYPGFLPTIDDDPYAGDLPGPVEDPYEDAFDYAYEEALPRVLEEADPWESSDIDALLPDAAWAYQFVDEASDSEPDDPPYEYVADAFYATYYAE